MPLETLYYASQTIAVVVIVATLVALLLQTRQTNIIARAELTQTQWLTLGSMMMAFYDTPEKADLLRRGLIEGGELTGAEKDRVATVLAIMISMGEGAYHLKSRGMIEPIIYDRNIDNIENVLRYEPARRWWSKGRARFRPPFRDIVDEIAGRYDGAGDAAGARDGQSHGVAGAARDS